MATESATYIDGLDSAKPTSGETPGEGDDHLRLIKSTIKATFPNVTGAVTPTHTELNVLDGIPATLTATELGYVDGVTSAIQTQLDARVQEAHLVEYDAGNSGTSKTIDFANGVNQKVSMTGNCAFTLSNPQSGYTHKIKMTQDGTGGRTATWTTTVKWAGGSAPVLTSTATTGVDIVSLYYDGSAWWGMVGQGFA